MTTREAAIFTAFADTVVAPAPPLAPVERTDAVQALGAWLDLAPKLNALGVRAALHAVDAAPLALGFGHRMRRLGTDQRARYLRSIETSGKPAVRQAVKALKGIAFLCYYGDDQQMLTLGYDADANVARARALRTAEGRP
jgi:hypothetical protein